MGVLRLNRVDQLPKSFDLAKYEPCNGFALRDWVTNLTVRSLAAFFLRHDPSHRHPDNGKEMAERILTHPIWPGRLDPQRARRMPFTTSAVEDMSVFSYFGALMEFDEDRYPAYCSAHKRFETEPSSELTAEERALLDAPIWKMYLDAGLSFESEVYATVNLDCTEEKAVEDFRAWFRQTKKALGLAHRRKRILPAEASDWARFRLLPYMDLYLWAIANEVEITNQLFGIAIFPDEYHITLSERIRKVVDPQARELFSEEFCDMLRVQVRADLSAAEPNQDVLLPDKYSYFHVAGAKPLPFHPDHPDE